MREWICISQTMKISYFLEKDFNVGMENAKLKDFPSWYSLASLNNKPICYKNPARTSCFDLISTSCQKICQNSSVAETWLFNFHMIDTVTKTSFRKGSPNPLSANPTKRSNILKQFVGNLPDCLSVFGHFVELALKGLILHIIKSTNIYKQKV